MAEFHRLSAVSLACLFSRLKEPSARYFSELSSHVEARNPMSSPPLWSFCSPPVFIVHLLNYWLNPLLWVSLTYAYLIVILHFPFPRFSSSCFSLFSVSLLLLGLSQEICWMNKCLLHISERVLASGCLCLHQQFPECPRLPLVPGILPEQPVSFLPRRFIYPWLLPFCSNARFSLFLSVNSFFLTEFTPVQTRSKGG